MSQYYYSPEHIHLPPSRFALILLTIISSAGLCLSAVLSIAMLIIGTALISPINVLAVLICCLTVFLYHKKIQALLKHYKLALFMLGAIITLIGIVNATEDQRNFGILFIPLGVGVMVTGSKIPHRFHFSQLILFAASLFNGVSFFFNLFKMISATGVDDSLLLNSLLFLSVTISLMLSKGDRGFIGLFTTDSHSSQLARRSMLSFVVLFPLISFLIVILEKNKLFDLQLGLALFLVSLIVLLVIILWINIRSLYPSEVERFLMQEALRINNITLERNASTLSTKVVELESAKKEIADKLNNQHRLVDILDSSA